jgi:hypothetical protein
MFSSPSLRSAAALVSASGARKTFSMPPREQIASIRPSQTVPPRRIDEGPGRSLDLTLADLEGVLALQNE